MKNRKRPVRLHVAAAGTPAGPGWHSPPLSRAGSPCGRRTAAPCGAPSRPPAPVRASCSGAIVRRSNTRTRSACPAHPRWPVHAASRFASDRSGTPPGSGRGAGPRRGPRHGGRGICVASSGFGKSWARTVNHGTLRGTSGLLSSGQASASARSIWSNDWPWFRPRS